MSARVLTLETTTHGRILIEDAAVAPAAGTIVAFHGYGQRADDILAEIGRVPGVSRWRVAAVQALHRFYSRNDERVIASWMTREDRDLAVADNVAYVDRAVDAVQHAGALVFAGFSQGAAMAHRAAALGRHAAAGVIALAGDIPPEVKAARAARPWPPVLIGAGDTDTWYTPPKVDADVAFLQSQGVRVELVRFHGGHEWTDEFRAAAGRWLAALVR